jgi:hypothetical protein
MRYDQVSYLKSLLDGNYKHMTEEDYVELKGRLEKIGSNKIDKIFEKALKVDK